MNHIAIVENSLEKIYKSLEIIWRIDDDIIIAFHTACNYVM